MKGFHSLLVYSRHNTLTLTLTLAMKEHMKRYMCMNVSNEKNQNLHRTNNKLSIIRIKS